MNKADRDHISAVCRLGCIACYKMGIDTFDVGCEAHHIGNGTMGKKASNHEVIGLCYLHHRGGGHGVAVHSGRKAFEQAHGTEQELLAFTLDRIKYEF